MDEIDAARIRQAPPVTHGSIAKSIVSYFIVATLSFYGLSLVAGIYYGKSKSHKFDWRTKSGISYYISTKHRCSIIVPKGKMPDWAVDPISISLQSHDTIYSYMHQGGKRGAVVARSVPIEELDEQAIAKPDDNETDVKLAGALAAAAVPLTGLIKIGGFNSGEIFKHIDEISTSSHWRILLYASPFVLTAVGFYHGHQIGFDDSPNFDQSEDARSSLISSDRWSEIAQLYRSRAGEPLVLSGRGRITCKVVTLGELSP